MARRGAPVQGQGVVWPERGWLSMFEALASCAFTRSLPHFCIQSFEMQTFSALGTRHTHWVPGTHRDGEE